MPAPLVPISLNLQSRGCSCYAPKDNRTSLAPRTSALTRYGSLVAVATIPHKGGRALLAPRNSAWTSLAVTALRFLLIPQKRADSHKKVLKRAASAKYTGPMQRKSQTHQGSGQVVICERTVGSPHAVPPSPGPSAGIGL